MPNLSFLELVMFARIFVDSIDAQHYEEHRKNGTCCLSVSNMENQHCYCRLLELLVNVWAYHSARKMVYVNPETGIYERERQQQYRLKMSKRRRSKQKIDRMRSKYRQKALVNLQIRPSSWQFTGNYTSPKPSCKDFEVFATILLPWEPTVCGLSERLILYITQNSNLHQQLQKSYFIDHMKVLYSVPEMRSGEKVKILGKSLSGEEEAEQRKRRLMDAKFFFQVAKYFDNKDLTQLVIFHHYGRIKHRSEFVGTDSEQQEM
ncbi:hypothetical protein SUGI_1002400 [Cryptomeria japonica]|nr:hypothetical protein SUGI_1002400 [Cryptomeria japonica]